MSIEKDEDGLTPGTLIDGARMYAAAADCVNDKLPNSLHVLCHLLGISIELALKAYLRHHRYSEKRLRDLGHDLGRLFDEAVKNGLEYTGSRSFVIRVTGINYRQRLFFYPRRATLSVITPWRLREVANEIITDSFRLVHGDQLYDKYCKDAGLAIRSKYPDDLEASNWAR